MAKSTSVSVVYQPLAKVSRPLLIRYHPRGRVYEILDRYGMYPVIWITGPAGCGKTTLVNSYIKERKLRCLWYRVDEGDDDPATFFYYMGQAVQAVSSGKKKPMPLLTPEYQPGIVTFTLRWFEQFFSRMPARSVIVLDNYHDIPDTSPLHALLRQGFSRIPRGTRVILISRKTPHQELIQLEANRQLATIGWSILRLQPQETAGMVELLAPGALSEEEIRDFHYLADGWAAGVVLMVQRAVREKAHPHVFFRQSPEVVFDYFASEVFENISTSTQDFLLKTAYLPSMSVAQAEELAGDKEAGHILRYLSQHNYFIERRFHSDAVYSYHALFREFLLARGRAVYTENHIRQIISDAAVILERSGQVDDALSLVSEAKGWDTMAQFIIQHGKEMLDQGRYRTLEHWLAEMPEDMLCTNPWLMFWLGASRVTFDPLGSIGCFEYAYNRFKENNTATGFFLSWAGLISAILWSTTIRPQVFDLIRELEERKKELLELPVDDIKAMVANSMFGILTIVRPEHPDIDEWYNLSLLLNRKIGNAEVIILTHSLSIFQRMHMKAISNGLEIMDTILQESLGKNLSELTNICIKNTEAMIYNYASLKDKCLDAVDKGLVLADKSGIHVNDIALLGHAAWCCLNFGDYECAVKYIDRFSQCQDQPVTWITCLAYLVQSQRAVIDNNYEQALYWVYRMLEVESLTYVKPIYALVLLHHAYIMHLSGNDEKACELISSTISVNENLQSPFIKVEILLLQALMEFDLGNVDMGQQHLREGLSISRAGGTLMTFWNLRTSLTSLCIRALEAGIEVDYVREIIITRNLLPEGIPMPLEIWPWPVKVYTLGRFEIVRDDVPVQPSKKAQKKPLEMLKALISLGGKQVGETHLADLFWPDADGDLAMQNCATTLHRLRKILGSNEAITMQNGMLSIDRNRCWVDASAFERLLDEAEGLWEKAGSEDHRKAKVLTCRALDLYRGGYLAEESWNPDAISMGEHLQDRYFMALYRLCRHLVDGGEWEEARNHFERGLAMDDCAEGCYQGLMICLPKLGQKAEALAVYERCRRTLEAKLGMKPSRETEALNSHLR